MLIVFLKDRLWERSTGCQCTGDGQGGAADASWVRVTEGEQEGISGLSVGQFEGTVE